MPSKKTKKKNEIKKKEDLRMKLYEEPKVEVAEIVDVVSNELPPDSTSQEEW